MAGAIPRGPNAKDTLTLPKRFKPEDYQLEDGGGRRPSEVQAQVDADKAKKKAERKDWSLQRQAAAAARTDNIVGSTFNATLWKEQRDAARRQYGATPGYDVVEDLWDEPEWRSRIHLFYGSRSPQETEVIKRRFKLEKDDEKVLEDSGFSGLVMKTAFGLVDVSSLPGVGPALRGGKAMRVAGGFAEEALTATASEVLLSNTQMDRDGQVGSVVLSTLAGGALKSLDTPDPPGLKRSDADLLTSVDNPQAALLRAEERGDRIVAAEERPAFGEAVKAMGGDDPGLALDASLRAISGDLAEQARNPQAQPLVKRQAEAILRQIGADERGGLSEESLAVLRMDLKGEGFPASQMSPARRAAVEEVSVSLRGLRRALAKRGEPVGPGGRSATDGQLKPADHLAMALSEIWTPPGVAARPAAQRLELSGALIVPGSPRWSDHLEGLQDSADRLAPERLSPDIADISTIDDALRQAAGPEAMARMEAGRGALIAGLDPRPARARSPGDDMAGLPWIVADPALAPLADAAAWRVASGTYGQSLAERLSPLADDVFRLRPTPMEAALAARAIDDSLTGFGVSLRGGRMADPAAWSLDPDGIVGRVIDMRLVHAILAEADGSPLARAQAGRLAQVGLDEGLRGRIAAQIRQAPPGAPATGRSVRTDTARWTDAGAARAMDRAVTAETRSALSGGEAGQVWKTDKLKQLLDAAVAVARERGGDLIEGWRRAPSEGFVGLVTANLLKGLLSWLLEGQAGESDEERAEPAAGPRPQGAELLSRGMTRSGLTAWLFEAEPPVEPTVAAPGLDTPTGRMVRNLTGLLVALEGPPERPGEGWSTVEDDFDEGEGWEQEGLLHRTAFVAEGPVFEEPASWSYFTPPDWRRPQVSPSPAPPFSRHSLLDLRWGEHRGHPRAMENPNLGGLASVRESRADPGAVSPASDPGGRSYGLYQFNSVAHIAESFLKADGKPFAAAFGPNPDSDTDAFKQTWQAIALAYPDEFSRAQFAYARRIYYEPAVAQLKSATGFDAGAGRWTLQDVLFSTWLQHKTSARRQILDQALAKSNFKARLAAPNRLKTPDQNAYELERDLIVAVYDARIAIVGGSQARHDLDGQFARERDRAVAMLQEEYKGRASF